MAKKAKRLVSESRTQLIDCRRLLHIVLFRRALGGVAELVGIEGGVVSGVTNLESSGVEASDWRPRHDEQYHEA
jgi:hypothetical protein